MSQKTIRVLILYGGDAATEPRDKLVAWMAKKKNALKAEPYQVAWGIPHSDGAVADRVRDGILHADKAIALVTPDPRSEYGAPNVIEEIGRWIQAKGGQTLCVIRHTETKINSNMAGLVYLSFSGSIKEVFDDLRDFITDESAASDQERPRKDIDISTLDVQPGSTTKPGSSRIFSGSTDYALIQEHLYKKITIEEHEDITTIALDCSDPVDEEILRRLSRGEHVNLAYRHRLIRGSITSTKFSHTEGSTAVLSISSRHAHGGANNDVAWGGGGGMSADEVAKLRARRLLTGHPRRDPADPLGRLGLEMVVRGIGGELAVDDSPIPRYLNGHSRQDPKTWERLRLQLVRDLVLSSCVHSIRSLELRVNDGVLSHVTLKATRQMYTNVPPFEIIVDEDVHF